MECDNGVFRPYGIAAVGTDSAIGMLRRIAPLLALHRRRFGAEGRRRGGHRPAAPGGRARRRPRGGWHALFLVPSHQRRYAETLDPREVARCVATMAVYAYVLAEMPERLPHGPVTTGARR